MEKITSFMLVTSSASKASEELEGHEECETPSVKRNKLWYLGFTVHGWMISDSFGMSLKGESTDNPYMCCALCRKHSKSMKEMTWISILC